MPRSNVRKRETHRADDGATGGRTVEDAGAMPSGVLLAIVWIGVAVYLLLFYSIPLPEVPGSQDVLRRWHVLLSAFRPEEIVPRWFAGASWQTLAQRAAILATAAAIFAVASAAGWICLRLARLDCRLTRLECLVFSAGVGLNLASLLTLALGLSGVMNAWVFAAIAVLVIGMAVALTWRGPLANDPTAKPGAARGKNGGDSAVQPEATLQLSGRWLWLALPFVVAILAGAMQPPVDFDVREYHLQAPKEFYQEGQVRFLPHNVYANMPLGAEMLSLLGMIARGDWWTGALVGKTLIALYAPLTALALLAAGRRFVTPAAGVVAALVYISIPWIALVSTQGLIEGAFAFFLLAALYGVLLWRASGPRGARSNRLLCLAGFMAGSAVSTKYPAAVFCVLPLTAWLLYDALDSADGDAPRPALSMALKVLGGFLLFVALGCGLWLAKNAALAGNPVYPLAYDLFGGETRTAAKHQQWRQVHDPPNFRLSDLAKRAADVTLKSNWLSPLVMPLAALGVLATPRRLAWWLAAYFGYVFITWWLFTHRIDRFWIPILPAVALLAGIGATWTSARWWRVPFIGLLILGLLSNFVVITSGVLGDNRYAADLNVLRVEAGRVDPWHLYLNEHADAVTGVLLVGDAQPFDLEVPATYNTVFDDSIFVMLARGRTPEELRQALWDRKISHIYVDWGEISRYRSPGNYGITKFIEPGVFERRVEAGVLVRLGAIEENPNELYRLAPASPERRWDRANQ